MKEKNVILLGIAILLLCLMCVAWVLFTNTAGNNTVNNTTMDLNDSNETNNTTDDGGKSTATNSKSSAGSGSSIGDVEEQEFDYTRDQPTKTEDGVNYNLIYGDDDKPSHWESSDGRRNVLPLKKDSGKSSSKSSRASNSSG